MFDKLKEDLRETLTGSTPENDLRARLHADHGEVAKLIDELLATGDYEIAMREDLRNQIVVGLTAHARAEEEVVYTWLQQDATTESDTRHAWREHDEIDQALAAVKAADAGDPSLKEKVEALKSVVTHHVHDEENELLPKAETRFGQAQLAQLIAPFNSRKTELMQELDTTTIRPRTDVDRTLGEEPSHY